MDDDFQLELQDNDGTVFPDQFLWRRGNDNDDQVRFVLRVLNPHSLTVSVQYTDMVIAYIFFLYRFVLCCLHLLLALAGTKPHLADALVYAECGHVLGF